MMSLERLRGVPSHKARAFVQLGLELARMRRSVGNTSVSDVKNRPIGIGGGVGEVRHPMGAHAPGELPIGGQHLLHQGRRAVAVLHALVFLLMEGPACREQVLARLLGGLVLRGADAVMLGIALGELSAAVGVGVVRYTLGAHA